ncbi:MAG: hypothetical protein RQ936_09465 [Gammaproteobacteria bacterium]|nr:hypothetical protein [Gammaproteobacteria bacterium]
MDSEKASLVFKPVKKLALLVCTYALACAANAYAVDMGDPLRPPEYRSKGNVTSAVAIAKPQWHVNEILFSGTRRVAVINDRVLAIGDHTNGAKVFDIKPGHVVLEYQNSFINAYLKSVSVKKRRIIN